MAFVSKLNSQAIRIAGLLVLGLSLVAIPQVGLAQDGYGAAPDQQGAPDAMENGGDYYEDGEEEEDAPPPPPPAGGAASSFQAPTPPPPSSYDRTRSQSPPQRGQGTRPAANGGGFKEPARKQKIVFRLVRDGDKKKKDKDRESER